jgi:hypothetical protein
VGGKNRGRGFGPQADEAAARLVAAGKVRQTAFMRTRSPFPGIDPYLEKYSRGVHHRLCTYACDALQPQVQPALRAEIDVRFVVEAVARRDHTVYPDVSITERESWRVREEGGVALELEPLIVYDDEPAREGFILISESGAGGRLVTAIEFLSPTNKLPGKGQDKYLEKQEEYIEGGVNLVEIDLVRRGEHIITGYDRIPDSHRTTYQVCVRRANKASTEVYPVPLQQALPVIRIPLREGDADARLNLQALIEQTYHNGAYGNTIDYTQPPDPPLDPADAAWAEELLKVPRG